jgi:hypothetical protein
MYTTSVVNRQEMMSIRLTPFSCIPQEDLFD